MSKQLEDVAQTFLSFFGKKLDELTLQDALFLITWTSAVYLAYKNITGVQLNIQALIDWISGSIKATGIGFGGGGAGGREGSTAGEFPAIDPYALALSICIANTLVNIKVEDVTKVLAGIKDLALAAVI